MGLTRFALDDGTCVATIDITGPEAAESWYHIWEEFVAVEGMCTWKGMEGMAFALGES